MPYLVREGLFIGNINDAAEVLESDSSEISHILSVLSTPSISFFSEWRIGLVIPSKEIKKVYADMNKKRSGVLLEGKVIGVVEYVGKELRKVRMGVGIRDMESEVLLDYLDICFEFIDEGRQNGAVLVHCFAGVSRSAAIVTAYLMKTEQLSLEDALESLKQSCEFVCPNDGFLDQVNARQCDCSHICFVGLRCDDPKLKMFEAMNFKVDYSSPIYKRFRLKVLGDHYNRGEKIDSSKFGDDPGMPKEVSSGEVEASTNGINKNTLAYRCKKCRRVIALQDNVMDHIPGEGETSFEWNKQKSGNPFNKSNENECSSLFVEPLRWMTAVEEGGLEGKLSCAHCDARLGYFNWSGIQCSCGSWITPAFQIHKSRVDVSTV